MNLKAKVFDTIDKVKTYWKTPMKGRHMTFREIAAYSGGGIGAYMIITIGTACILGIGNTLISSTLGVDPTDMYIMYVIAVLANIPMTGIRANIIDNTRNKAGKYRPYIVSMAIPTAVLCIAMVWFPYSWLNTALPKGEIFGESYAYVVKCALILLFNLGIHFFYYFFYDGYENLIHVLSPNSQERADVASIKCLVYSIAPSVINLLSPLIASNLFETNLTDIRVYRLLYPILGVGGILLCIIVYKYTEEKIVQARTHVARIRFSDALRAVFRNKYFWIISLAGWIGFLESASYNIFDWLYNYGGVCTGNAFGIIKTIYGNASFWGMLFAPFCIRKWGKRAVLVFTNVCNIVFILCLLPATKEIGPATMWIVLPIMFMNGLVGAFAHILNPSIQADIRDYQQYKSGERIDGMFSAVATIGTVITLLTSSVLPTIYEKNGISKANAAIVTSNPEVLNRMTAEGKTVGQILTEQFELGQDNFNNAYSALYDFDVLQPLLHVLIIVSAVGALMNVIPYFWYDFNERKQKSVIRVLKVRAMFEDYANGVLKDRELVEAIDIIRDARRMANETEKVLDKSSYRNITDKAERKLAKKAYQEDVQFNEEIEISKFVCAELDKFSNPLYKGRIARWQETVDGGINALLNMNSQEINYEIRNAKALSRSTKEEKENRSFEIEEAKIKRYAFRTIVKYYSNATELSKPDYSVLEGYYEKEDNLDVEIKALYSKLNLIKIGKETGDKNDIKKQISYLEKEKKNLRKLQKTEMDEIANISRAIKPYLDAEINLSQMKNYTRFEEIEALYDEAKQRAEEEERQLEIKKALMEKEEKEYAAKIKEEKKKKKIKK